MARDKRDAWDYYGPAGPNLIGSGNSSTSALPALMNTSAMSNISNASNITPAKMMQNNHPTNGFGRSVTSSSVNARQSPTTTLPIANGMQPQQLLQHHSSAKELREFQRNNPGPVALRDPRFSLLSSGSPGPKVENGPINGSPVHASSSPQRLFNQIHGLAFKTSTDQQRIQHQQAGQHHPSASQQSIQFQQQAIQQLQYPYYNAKLESLTHKMPNLSFEGLGHQQQQSPAQSANGQTLIGRTESSSITGLMHVHSSPLCSSSSPISSSSSTPSTSCTASAGTMPEKLEGSSHVVASSQAPELGSEQLAGSAEGQTLGQAAASTVATGAVVGIASANNRPDIIEPVSVTGNCDPTTEATGSLSYSALDISNQVASHADTLCCQSDASISVSAAGEGAEMKFPFSLHRLTQSSVNSDSSIVLNDKTTTDTSVSTLASADVRADICDEDKLSSIGQSNRDSLNTKKEDPRTSKDYADCGGALSDFGLIRLADLPPLSNTVGQEEMLIADSASHSLVSAIDVIVAGKNTPESTDCGSLSKSSSDGDPIGVVSRKRPPTKLKSRRRNILSFPHHISVDELRLIQVSHVFFIFGFTAVLHVQSELIMGLICISLHHFHWMK